MEVENISVNKYSIKIKWRIKIYQRKNPVVMSVISLGKSFRKNKVVSLCA